MSAIEADVVASKVLLPWQDLKGAPHPVAPARPRSRTHLVRMGEGWPEPGWIGLPIPAESQPAAFLDGGQEGDPFGGVPRACVPRVHAVKDVMQPYVPFIACRSMVPIPIPPSPTDTAGIEIHAVLAEDTWSRLQAKAVHARGGVCEICGDGAAPRAIPVWHHLIPRDPQLEGVRRLDRLLVVCPDCADMFQQDADGKSVVHRDRLMAVNAWTVDEWEAHEAWRQRASALLTGYDWVIDLSAIGDDGPVEIVREWKVDEADWRLRNGRSSTLVLGTPFSVAGAIYEAQPVQPFLDAAAVTTGGQP